MFHLFNEAGIKMCRLFANEPYQETLDWATKQIKGIEDYTVLDWLMCKEKADFFCTELCSARKSCPNGAVQLGAKKKKEEEYEGYKDE